jgi:hypothetical protein
LISIKLLWAELIHRAMPDMQDNHSLGLQHHAVDHAINVWLLAEQRLASILGTISTLLLFALPRSPHTEDQDRALRAEPG